MSTYNICFCREIRKQSILFDWKSFIWGSEPIKELQDRIYQLGSIYIDPFISYCVILIILIPVIVWASEWENVPSDKRSSKTQISARIRAIWSVFVRCMKIFAVLAVQNAPSEDSEQPVYADLNLRWAHVLRYVFLSTRFI